MWCQREDMVIDLPHLGESMEAKERKQKPPRKKMRCPECGKHMETRSFFDDNLDCWKVVFSAHKIPKAKRKRKKYQDISTKNN